MRPPSASISRTSCPFARPPIAGLQDMRPIAPSVAREQGGAPAHPRGGVRGLDAGVAAADDEDVEQVSVRQLGRSALFSDAERRRRSAAGCPRGVVSPNRSRERVERRRRRATPAYSGDSPRASLDARASDGRGARAHGEIALADRAEHLASGFRRRPAPRSRARARERSVSPAPALEAAEREIGRARDAAARSEDARSILLATTASRAGRRAARARRSPPPSSPAPRRRRRGRDRRAAPASRARRDADALDGILGLAQTRRVDELDGNAVDVDRRLERVARRARNVRHDRARAAGERIEKRRLAGVRRPEKHDPAPSESRRPVGTRREQPRELAAAAVEPRAHVAGQLVADVLGEVERRGELARPPPGRFSRTAARRRESSPSSRRADARAAAGVRASISSRTASAATRSTLAGKNARSVNSPGPREPRAGGGQRASSTPRDHDRAAVNGDLDDVLARARRAGPGRTSRARGRSAAPAASRTSASVAPARRERIRQARARGGASDRARVAAREAHQRRARSGPAASPSATIVSSERSAAGASDGLRRHLAADCDRRRRRPGR